MISLGIDLTTVKRKQDKPDTEDPNKGVSLLTIELQMTRNSSEHSVATSSAAVSGDSCTSMGDTCAGQGRCYTLPIVVRFLNVNAATTEPLTTTSCSSNLVQSTAAVPLAQWGGAM